MKESYRKQISAAIKKERKKIFGTLRLQRKVGGKEGVNIAVVKCDL